MGVGAVCSAVLIASAGDRLPRGMLMLVSVMLYGFFTVMFAASPWFWLSMVLMVIVGLCHVHSRPCANGHPILFAYRVPRPDHGYLPHEPGRADDRRHALRSAVILCRGAVGGGVNGRRRRADHDRDRPGSAGRAVYPITIKRSGNRPDFPVSHSGQHAVTLAVGEINDNAEEQPADQPKPVFRGQRKHQQQAEGDTEKGHERHKRAAEGALNLWMTVTHDEDGGADNDERQQGADIHQLGEHSERQERSHESHHAAS